MYVVQNVKTSICSLFFFVLKMKNYAVKRFTIIIQKYSNNKYTTTITNTQSKKIITPTIS